MNICIRFKSAFLVCISLLVVSLSAQGAPSEKVMTPYLEIQRLLAADSMEGVPEQAAELAKVMPEAGAMAEATDIRTARSEFDQVSRVLIADLKAGGDPAQGAGEYYLAHCPMAFGNKGASWVQAEAKLSNPYFGASMLRCGTIRPLSAK